MRTHTIFIALLSSNAPYPPLLDLLGAAVTQYLGGMAIAEDILRGDPCKLYFKDQLRFLGWPPWIGGQAL